MDKLLSPPPGAQIEVNVGHLIGYPQGFGILAEFQPEAQRWLIHFGKEGKFCLVAPPVLKNLLIEAICKGCPAFYYDNDNVQGCPLTLVAQPATP